MSGTGPSPNSAWTDQRDDLAILIWPVRWWVSPRWAIRTDS